MLLCLLLNYAEFRRDVIAVARKKEAPLVQIARDFGISDATLYLWMKQADIDDGTRQGVSGTDATEMRKMKKRMRLLE